MEDADEQRAILGLNIPSEPIAGERMFRGDLPDWKNNACPHWYADGLSWSLIAEGYLRSANVLVAAVMRGEESPDEMLYPICFAYRHGLELRLKEIILLGNRLDSGLLETESTHSLSNLWRKARAVLAKHVDVQEGVLDAMEPQIDELDGVDRTGEEFRYPKTLARKGSPARVTLATSRHINLRHVRDVMASIEAVLYGSISVLWDRFDPVELATESGAYEANGNEALDLQIVATVRSRNPDLDST
ncbi:MAG TPA: hypothetical protein VLC92_07000 [Rhodocyclaceae bacterium]|nr:hypothetical protein [Rhodocyclaceae bacterium]